MEKQFDEWNSIKKEINASEKAQGFFCKEREIWWCGLGVNIGIETDGKNDNFERPVLILRVFNRDMIWVLPITSRIRNAKFYYRIKYDQQDRWVVLSQLRTISTKRLFRKIELLSHEDFKKIGLAVRDFVASETPPIGGESRRPKP